MTFEVNKAVIPAAGLGTRFLPATKAMPKEMLPVVDRPAIQYVVEEAVEAGLTDILMVTGRNKTPLENHFDRVLELESALEERGDQHKLEAVRHASNLADVHYLRQGSPLGLGHAVYRAHQHVGDESFAVLLGDDIIAEGGQLLREMVRVHRETGASVVAVQEVPQEQVSSYGVVAPQLVDGEFKSAGDYEWPTYWVNSLVEKPAVEDAPSNFAVIGRYVLRPEAFAILENTPPGRGGEIQLTDALVEMAANREETGGVVALVYGGRRFDTGNKFEYLKANIELAIANSDHGPEVREWIQQYAQQLAQQSQSGS
ncbi:UTP--glucose-1-phosphate uridylyltransferase GalU [Gulosibacter sp. ACHW.36C]|uniref:UTP--glucose-1-phosphate uridylyltransferase n=1 Tax=Gulosibacter sediminis TaxID=1729695 RepID=A0ABY4N0U2_9MICO|nr:UTP--glucose-1-phosphate uridylyltransferase GalU [Gulosibacter sediminis]UQN15580.1 UTP--glucose-1-phosphate uridylyltransferase GalU [Gulosibacter sediminis]